MFELAVNIGAVVAVASVLLSKKKKEKKTDRFFGLNLFPIKIKF